MGPSVNYYSFSNSIELTHFWRSQNRQAIQTLEEARDAVQTLHVGQTYIIAGSVDGHVRTYDLRMGELRSDFIGRASFNVFCDLFNIIHFGRSCNIGGTDPGFPNLPCLHSRQPYTPHGLYHREDAERFHGPCQWGLSLPRLFWPCRGYCDLRWRERSGVGLGFGRCTSIWRAQHPLLIDGISGESHAAEPPSWSS